MSPCPVCHAPAGDAHDVRAHRDRRSGPTDRRTALADRRRPRGQAPMAPWVQAMELLIFDVVPAARAAEATLREMGFAIDMQAALGRVTIELRPVVVLTESHE